MDGIGGLILLGLILWVVVTKLKTILGCAINVSIWAFLMIVALAIVALAA